MTRVLWIHQNFVAADGVGNARGSHVLAALQKRGVETCLVTSRESYLGDVDTQAPAQETHGCVTVHRVAPIGGSGLARGARPRSYAHFAREALRIARAEPPPDVVFATTPPLPQALVSAWLAMRWRRPLVLEVRDLWPAFLREGGLLSNPASLFALECVEAFVYRSAASVVAASPGFVPYLKSMGCEPVKVVPTGASSELTRVDLATGDAWREARRLGDAPVVAYTGSLQEAYGVSRMLAAAALLPNVHWFFAGNGRERERVVAASAEHANVHYLGSLPRFSLIPMLTAADVLIDSHADWPLLDATLTGKLFEAIALGKPVVSIGSGARAWLVRTADAGISLVRPTAQQLAIAVAESLATPAARKRERRSRSIAFAREVLDAEQLALRLVDHLEEIASQPHRSGAALARLTQAVLDGLRRRSRAAEALLRGEAGEQRIVAACERWLRDARDPRGEGTRT